MTTGLTSSGLREETIGGFPGVVANYTSSYNFQFSALVYMDLMNSVGQTVSWSVVQCSFNANQTVSCVLPIQPGVVSGSYTAYLFATSVSSVPVSQASSLNVSV